MTTDEVLIQKTIELCRDEIKSRQSKVDALKQLLPTGDEICIPRHLEYFNELTLLKSWEIYLAEFEEHHSEMLPSGSFDYAGNPLYSEQCNKCQNGEMYPCREALIKAKRLLERE